ncbi:zinc-dependent metalloprotease [Enemella sp. A6]|uniref:zinc-dependent metalloprotease n=1 Tax=Enemella sp. A6 TaxID=3440152 RepID=UPI003EBB819E
MSDDRPGDQQPEGDPNQPQNPFEALFGPGGMESLFGGAGTGAEGLAEFMQGLQNMFSGLGLGGTAEVSGSGVNWATTKDLVRRQVAALGTDPSPSDADRRAVTEAVGLADTWLDQATDLPRVSGPAATWSRAEWVEQTMPVWQRLVEPVAASIADAMADSLTFGEPAEDLGPLAGMHELLRPMLRQSGGAMFSHQLAQALGQLATEVLGSTDIGLPLDDGHRVALVPVNVAAFGEGLAESATDVQLYVALRESARQRLFAHAPWLGPHLLALVEEYAHGITIDTSALESAVGEMDPASIDPAALQELSDQLQGQLFTSHKTPEQLATLERLETMLALVEGWVDEVVSQATSKWMPSAVALAEAMRRRRATGGPAEATFATLVGLELRPRRMRDAANLWAAMRDARGAAERDAVWAHPDLLPRSSALDDPMGYVKGETDDNEELDLDAELRKLLDDQE